MNYTGSAVSLIVITMLFAPPVSAQETALRPDRGPSLALGVGSGATVGLWNAVGDRTDAGIEVSARISRLEADDQDLRVRALALAVPVQRFLDEEGPVVPYLTGAPFVEYARNEFPEAGASAESIRWEVGARFGLGLHWFPTARVGLGGHAGIDAAYLLEDETAPSVGGIPAQDVERTGFSIGTFTSGIRARLYFR